MVSRAARYLDDLRYLRQVYGSVMVDGQSSVEVWAGFRAARRARFLWSPLAAGITP